MKCGQENKAIQKRYKMATKCRFHTPLNILDLWLCVNTTGTCGKHVEKNYILKMWAND